MKRNLNVSDEIWEYYCEKSKEYGIDTIDASPCFKSKEDVDAWFADAKKNFANYWSNNDQTN